MKLNNSRLCIDCDTVFEHNKAGRCPACGSETTEDLTRWVLPLTWVQVPLQPAAALPDAGC